jgi:hypothetical protein
VHRLISLDRPPRSLKDRNPWLALTRRLIARWSCSTILVQVRTALAPSADTNS